MQNFTCLQIISEWIIAYCGKTSKYTIPTLVLQLPTLAIFPLELRISLHSHVVSYVTYKLSVCKQ